MRWTLKKNKVTGIFQKLKIISTHVFPAEKEFPHMDSRQGRRFPAGNSYNRSIKISCAVIPCMESTSPLRFLARNQFPCRIFLRGIYFPSGVSCEEFIPPQGFPVRITFPLRVFLQGFHFLSGFSCEESISPLQFLARNPFPLRGFLQGIHFPSGFSCEESISPLWFPVRNPIPLRVFLWGIHFPSGFSSQVFSARNLFPRGAYLRGYNIVYNSWNISRNSWKKVKLWALESGPRVRGLDSPKNSGQKTHGTVALRRKL